MVSQWCYQYDLRTGKSQSIKRFPTSEMQAQISSCHCISSQAHLRKYRKCVP